MIVALLVLIDKVAVVNDLLVREVEVLAVFMLAGVFGECDKHQSKSGDSLLSVDDQRRRDTRCAHCTVLNPYNGTNEVLRGGIVALFDGTTDGEDVLP